MRLGIVYHRPFYRDAAGGLWEAEGAFARYVESLAHYVDTVLLFAPNRSRPFPSDAYRLKADNVELCRLPFFDRLPAFYAGLPAMVMTLWRELPRCDLMNLRVPTPLGVYAYLLAGARRRPLFLLVVGDLSGVARSVRVNSLKRLLYRAYLAVEEQLQAWMTRRAPTFVNGHALYAKYNGANPRVLLTTTSTISESDIGARADPLADNRAGEPIRLLCVSRIDPRKGLRYLPAALADLVDRGHNARITIVGPIVGALGREERELGTREAAARGVAERFDVVVPKSLPTVLKLGREHHLFVLPTLPGEGVPRVLLEAMANGLPIVATNVAGVSTVVAQGVNGLLVGPADSAALATAVDRVIRDDDLRRRMIQNGYTVARAHTVDAHARKIALGLVKMAGIRLHREGRPVAPPP